MCCIAWGPINTWNHFVSVCSAAFCFLLFFFFAFSYLVLTQITFSASSLCTIFGCVFHFVPLTSMLWSTLMISYMMLSSYMLMASEHLCALGLLISSFLLHFLVSIFPKMLQHVAQAKQSKDLSFSYWQIGLGDWATFNMYVDWKPILLLPKYLVKVLRLCELSIQQNLIWICRHFDCPLVYTWPTVDPMFHSERGDFVSGTLFMYTAQL